jgi:hypothetical protein
VQIWQAAYCMADELTITADATSDSAATFALKGMGYFPTSVSAPTFPRRDPRRSADARRDAVLDGCRVGDRHDRDHRAIHQDRLDDPDRRELQELCQRADRRLNFSKTGRTRRAAKATIEVELNDISIAASKEYLTWEADSTVKLRIRLNGGLIEGALYSYVNLDIYGPLDALEFGSVADTNRTMRFTVESQYDSTLGASFSLSAQSQRTTL